MRLNSWILKKESGFIPLSFYYADDDTLRTIYKEHRNRSAVCQKRKYTLTVSIYGIKNGR